MIMQKNQSIGVFDSGFGGLEILRGIARVLPDYNYIYLGDTARTPYGTRSPEVVYEFTTQAVDFLFQRGCALIIFSFNTASSDALRKIQQEYVPVRYPGKKVLGVLIPAAEAAIAATRGAVGVMATDGTVRSNAFIRELTKLNPKVRVVQQACPLLVPVVEAGEHESKAAGLILKKYLDPLIRQNIDTLILGCTHYGILEHRIRAIVGPDMYIVSEAKVVPEKLKGYLERHSEVRETLGQNKIMRFYSTDVTDTFRIIGSAFFGQPIKAEKAVLE